MADDQADFNQTLRLRLARFSYLSSLHLFDRGERGDEAQPLAERMHPRGPSELFETQQLPCLGPFTRQARASGQLRPLLFWGPPGSGKSALARLVAQASALRIERLDPAAGDELHFRRELERVTQPEADGSSPLVFIDAIERSPKSRLLLLLPLLEAGKLSLVAATSDNPWIGLPGALLEHLHVLELPALHERDLTTLLERALRDLERGLGELELQATPADLARIAHAAGGDARRALDQLQTAAQLCAARGDRQLHRSDIDEALAQAHERHPQARDHAGLERAFMQALRGSDPDAALYWMIRMLQAGEVPAFILRRMILFASEDIGNADPAALELAVTSDQVLQRLGMPEALRSMGQCCVYLASAPKSNASYLALQLAERDAREHGSLPVPAHSASSGLLPAQLHGRQYYCPTEHGFEARLRQRLEDRKR